MSRNKSASQRIVPPSQDVRDEALRRAHALADGLFPHQVDGVAFLLGRRRSILADDMGLGKTRQSIVALTEAAPNGRRNSIQARRLTDGMRKVARARLDDSPARP